MSEASPPSRDRQATPGSPARARLGKLFNKITFDTAARVFADEICCDVRPTSLLLDPSASVATQGSCFALNIAERLNAMGVKADTIPVREWLNNPFANLVIADSWVHGASSPYAGLLHQVMFKRQDELEIFKEKLRTASVLVCTLGTGFVWEHIESRKKVLAPEKRRVDQYRTVFLDHAVLVKLIAQFVDRVRMLAPSIYIWFTLSPVPCEGTTVFRSAITSDVVSKSLLRAAIFTYLSSSKAPRIQYFPAFELIRGVAAQFPQAFFGQDGKNRHVNPEIVALVVDEFIRRNQQADAAADDPTPPQRGTSELVGKGSSSQ